MASSLCSNFARLSVAPQRMTFRSSMAPQKLMVAAPKVNVSPEIAQPVVAGKLKTRKAAAKRYKVSGSGKVMARHCGKQHMNEKKHKDRKRKLGNEIAVFPGDVDRNVRKNLPYATIKTR